MIARQRQPVIIPETEVKLCEAFILRARLEGFAVYPEVSGWDIIIVDSTGSQCGIQAKLHANVEVLAQAIRGKLKGPKYRAVLVPKANAEFRRVARALRLKVFTLNDLKLSVRLIKTIDFSSMHVWNNGKQHWLPPIPSSCPAGSPAPRTLTQWRVKALELCIILEDRGFLTGEDFKRWGVNQAGWLARGELIRDGKLGKFARYLPGTAKLPSVGFEVEMERLRHLKRLKNS